MLLTGCLNPDDIFPLRGTVATPGQRVTLQRAPQATRDECADTFVDFKETNADADGGYTFEIFRAQAQSLSTGFNFCFRAATTYASGTQASVVTQRVSDEVELPLLPDWQSRLSTRYSVDWSPDGGTESSASFFVYPIAFLEQGDVGFAARHFVTLTGADGAVQWRQGDSIVVNEAMELQLFRLNADPRITTEFGGGTVRATGTYTRASQVIDAFNADVRTVWTPLVSATSGDTLLVDGPAQVPPSRGASCDGYDVCPFTDGVLVPAELASTTLTLRFSQPFSPTLVVLRGVVLPVTRTESGDLDSGRVLLSASNIDGGSVGPSAGLGGLLTGGTFVHDFDGAVVALHGGTFEYPPTYLAIPLSAAEPIATLRFALPALRIDEISVW